MELNIGASGRLKIMKKNLFEGGMLPEIGWYVGFQHTTLEGGNGGMLGGMLKRQHTTLLTPSKSMF